jgi:hypothetical protein
VSEGFLGWRGFGLRCWLFVVAGRRDVVYQTLWSHAFLSLAKFLDQSGEGGCRVFGGEC